MLLSQFVLRTFNNESESTADSEMTGHAVPIVNVFEGKRCLFGLVSALQTGFRWIRFYFDFDRVLFGVRPPSPLGLI